MFKACIVVSLFIYTLLNSVSYAASLLGVASITVQNSVSVHETKSFIICIFSKSVYKGDYYKYSIHLF